jgi:hypothetical protein
MAKRESTVLLKRSNVPGKVPTTLQLGELALNIADVKLYASGTTENDIVQIGWDKISRTGDTVTGNFVINGNLNATSFSATTYQNLPFNVNGSTNSIPVFTSSNVLVDSVITQSGGNVGIGVTSPTDTLHVSGTTRIATVNNGVGDFLTRDSNGVITRRTSSEVLTDIGAQAVLTNPVTGTGANGQISFWTGTNTQSGDNSLVWDNTDKRLVISGYNLTGSNNQPLLDLSGTWDTTGTPTLIRANVANTNSNSSSLLMDIQIGGTSQFQLTRGGDVGVVNTSRFTGRSLFTQGGSSTSNNIISSNNNYSGVSGVFNVFNHTGSFNPTSGNAILRVLRVGTNINQTGTANGVTRGIHIEPALTSAADWRSIEWSNNTGKGLYGVGTATNNIQGNTGIGLLTIPSAKLQVKGNGSTSATTALRVENSGGVTSMLVTDHGLLQHTSNNITSISSNIEVYRFAASLGNTFKMMYTIQDGSNLRGGEYLCVHNGINVNTVHTFPTEFGSISGIDFTFVISSGDVVITAVIMSGQWDVKLSVQIL